ncbi:tRNA glutamyl-Q synthetase [Desulfurivibrio alkaliphilus]|uniref:Glutamyl/glutaminyl-tRNA synthetase, class Ic, catalytic domain protein n=1 Tax=Desulfurivibrio alkaliphilus (strain DSM 19089 / UNIQEM U267 / AHT2) TaxID=589865 RepID=D6Z548_DESAT|nr:tRNA glutamyl-Q synthetase [Desulfurivibrio alkaliphilus]ADH86673.1 Glutamyl/glutaminyl-tRNA synthetase, class Ic, catalytic domain protein [Desulfurivibrio alkaliphilus AHT 2]
MLRSRLAPTPSGYLHLGNAVNFILTWLLVRRADGRLKLRIDDADAGRSRPEYIEDIFRQLEWLGLDWDLGPAGPDEFTARYSQLQRLERYRAGLNALQAQQVLFFCHCTRRQIKKISADHLYPGTCRSRFQAPVEPHTVRIRVPHRWVFDPASQEAAWPFAAAWPTSGEQAPKTLLRETPSLPPVLLATEMGDFILWRRDNLPAYQLASLLDDLDDEINLIVRGLDLLPSTAAQVFLAEQLGPAGAAFLGAEFLHHPLLTDRQGRKLAKSDQALSLAAMRAAGTSPAAVYRRAARFLGLPADEINTLADLLAAVTAP